MDRQTFSLVVFCGMDGVGKSTLAKKVSSFFAGQGSEFEFIHSHGYSVSRNSFGLGEGKVRSLRYLFKLLMPLALVDNLVTFHFKYKPILRRRNLICDRYFYDKLARMMYYGICSNLMARAYLRLLPRPDHVFFLDVDPRQACARKGEYSEKDYTAFRSIYRFIAEYLKAPIIDTSLSEENCYQEILKMMN